jgi:hypothetical protein
LVVRKNSANYFFNDDCADAQLRNLLHAARISCKNQFSKGNKPLLLEKSDGLKINSTLPNDSTFFWGYKLSV